MFDFWFEYKKVVPKGYVRLLGKIAELSDSGINMHFFVGNHDMWMNTYFQNELNIPVYFEPKEFIFNEKSFLIGHGDGLGPGDHGYKTVKKFFEILFAAGYLAYCRLISGWVLPTISAKKAAAMRHIVKKNF